MKIFWSISGDYEVAGLKPWRYLVADVATQRENPKLQRQNYRKNVEHKKHEHRKAQHIERQLENDILGLSQLRWAFDTDKYIHGQQQMEWGGESY